MPDRYDAIVLGLGGMGSATVAHLARRGWRTLGVEQFTPNHARGSSHGHSRIIREAYFEAPEYVPLVQHAYTLWRALEAETGASLLTITGGLNIGAPDAPFVTGARESAARFGLQVEELSATEVNARFPGFALPDDMVAVYEPTAGILQPEACVSAHLDVARRDGAELRFEEPVARWSVVDGVARVETQRGSYEAERLVITAGPWAGDVLASLKLPLRVRRIVNAHFEPERPELYDPQQSPVWLLATPVGEYYGFPALPGDGVKLGRHDTGEDAHPNTIRRVVDDAEVEQLRDVLRRYLPGAAGPLKWTLTCMYTMTPDAHFILDRHPAHEQVVFGCGFSGHGYKFASAIGETLAELAIDGRSRHDVGFLRLGRFAAAGAA